MLVKAVELTILLHREGLRFHYDCPVLRVDDQVRSRPISLLLQYYTDLPLWARDNDAEKLEKAVEHAPAEAVVAVGSQQPRQPGSHGQLEVVNVDGCEERAGATAPKAVTYQPMLLGSQALDR